MFVVVLIDADVVVEGFYSVRCSVHGPNINIGKSIPPSRFRRLAPYSIKPPPSASPRLACAPHPRQFARRLRRSPPREQRAALVTCRSRSILAVHCVEGIGLYPFVLVLLCSH
ncbi:hypothetical protein GUJ93_ZPchr0013g37913 [Zizania palustris]|uniref:Uncharacterized protein n=1 Tax=Zizania palustris TaxID=103762 RepID=A0A8J5X244_ZIZPA|nr:hypothetical protein GUJ93_ZPchr0013g37913 [Zizania palustris]